MVLVGARMPRQTFVYVRRRLLRVGRVLAPQGVGYVRSLMHAGTLARLPPAAAARMEPPPGDPFVD